MNHSHKNRRKVQEARPILLTGKPNPGLLSTKAAPNEVKNVVPDPPGSSVMHAAPPVMLTPRIALRRLCAGTGCEVGIETLYWWIAKRKIDSVRVGGRIFIPVEALDNLIKQCLAGERLY